MFRIGKLEIVISGSYASRLFGLDVGRSYYGRELYRVELGIGTKTRLVVRWEPKLTLEEWRPHEEPSAYAARLASRYGSTWMQHAKPKPGDVDRLREQLEQLGAKVNVETPAA